MTFSEDFKQRLSLLGLASVPISIAFWSIPAVLLSGNSDDLVNPFDFYRYFVMAGIFALGLMGLILYRLKFSIAHRIAVVLASFGIGLFIFDIVAPLDMGPMQDGTEKASFSIVLALLQLGLFVLSERFLRKVPVRQIGPTLGVFSFVFALMSLPSLYSSEATTGSSTQTPEKSQAELSSKPAPGRPNFNVYHIIFDAYFGPWLQWSMQEIQGDVKTLDDFVHYPRARSNYPETIPSFSSFMSGTVYDPKDSLSSWHQKSVRDSLITDMQKAGFDLHIYAGSPRISFREIPKVTIAQSPPLRLLADYWFLRVSPVILRPVILRNGVGPFSYLFQPKGKHPNGDLRTYASYQMFQKIMKEVLPQAPQTGQYYHFYFNLPHGPYEMKRDGTLGGKTSYYEQLHLATRSILELIEALKKSPTYDQDLIIIHSDHGSPWGLKAKNTKDPLKDFVKMDEATSQAIKKIDRLGNTGFKTEVRHRPLLLVKARSPCKSGAFQSQPGLVQLLDLRNFIRGQSEKPADHCQFPSQNSVNVYNGLYLQRGPKDRSGKLVSRDIRKGFFNHYEVFDDEHWVVHENLPFRSFR